MDYGGCCLTITGTMQEIRQTGIQTIMAMMKGSVKSKTEREHPDDVSFVVSCLTFMPR